MCLGAGIVRWYATLKEWTDVAISIAGRERAKRGMDLVVRDARRSLKLAIRSLTARTDP